MIKICLNGQEKSVPQGLTLAELAAELNIDVQKVAIAKNLEVIIRSELNKITLVNGDEVEVFHAVGGG